VRRSTITRKCVNRSVKACETVLVMSLALHPRNVTAQSKQDASIAHQVSCIDTASLAATVPHIVYIRATVKDSADARIGPMVDLYAQSVAQGLRRMFHPRGDTLPPGEPAITWRGIESPVSLTVTVFRNAASVYQLLSPRADSVAAAMLLSAAHTAADSGEGPFWPDSMPGDSLSFGLSYEFSLQKMQVAPTARPAFPVFYGMFPPEIPARQVSKSAPHYPDGPLRRGAIATVIVDFRVDTTGHLIPGTARDVWNSGQKRLTGDMLSIYNEFLQSVLTWLPTAEFTPARFGNCLVSQLVEQPFTFSISH